MLSVYTVTVFLSAFLLFLVQPLIAKQILPWFGGSAAVWTTCMVFFQSGLLAGYAYADAMVRKCRPAVQGWTHIGLLVASLVMLPIVPGVAWKPLGNEDPVLLILGLLVAVIGLPYFVLAATSPLLQAWFARSFPSGTPYRLFALSNLAAVFALIAYPFYIEPWIPVRTQVLAWSVGYTLFVSLCAAAAWHVARQPPDPVDKSPVGVPTDFPPTIAARARWLALSALGVVMLLAVTNHLSRNIASVPFLWVAPLSLYLLTFVLCFDTSHWYRRRLFFGLLIASLVAMALLLDSLELELVAPIFLVGLFAACMVCHGELAALRPDPRHLTGYYLSIALGGAIGGVLIGIVAPLALVGYFELGLALVACAVLLLAHLATSRSRWAVAFAIALPVTVWGSYTQIGKVTDGALHLARNFYGAVSVRDYGGDASWRSLRHGAILHGGQYLAPDPRHIQPSTYYSSQSGVGMALATIKHPARIGAVGLGAGTLAAYGSAGDVMRFYEIDPEMIAIARSYFTFLGESRAKIEVVLGDARLSLEREPPQEFDLLVIDAFSGDAIPAHLLTVEAFDVYLRHLKPEGLLVVHATNRYLDLPPVIARVAHEKGLHALQISDDGISTEDSHRTKTDWVVIARAAAPLAPLASDWRVRKLNADPALALWTDDFNNLFQALK
jgi:spermidine synthase